ncbi:MAG: DUF2497 domain-containing protein [Erythrobacter sp.]|uniref:DUF2497 domain-containing protein n=1 Tax=Erythrobacter sp. TaxID=1042 RepID=UPI00261764E7|nr:DUF2497 domain-containing protein [Erythrobacter sp.]MDJ0978494.1 DUF2497 domain-containing protein [Erythrobacter sp.]
MAQNSEASVEEILESIKKVIARDNRKDAEEARQLRDADERDAEPASDDEAEEVLDLGDMLAEEGLEDTDEPDEEEGAITPADAPLVAEEVRGAMQDNLAALAMLAEPGAKPQIVRTGETSLEGLTRELLRPMLAQWLEDNLPAMVEAMVQAEIARIAGKRR